MWVSKDSVHGTAFSYFLSMHLLGCQNLALLKNEKIKEKINLVSEWNKFSLVSSLAKVSKNQ